MLIKKGITDGIFRRYFPDSNRTVHFPIALQDLTVLPTEFFRRCKTHIPSVIILLTESKTEIIRR